MNLSELSRFDIKDLQKIDYPALLQSLRHKPEVLVALTSFLVSFLVIAQIVALTQKDLRSLQNEKTTLEEKVKQIDTLSSAKANLDSFVSNIPPTLQESEAVSMLTDLAIAKSIKITSLLPLPGESTPYFDTFYIDLDVLAANYESLWSFIRDIETYKHPIRVESCLTSLTVDPDSANRARGTPSGGTEPAEKENKLLSARMKLVIVNLKASS